MSPGRVLKASVVIATRNRKEDLAAAIRSALAQTVPLEVLVIDDGSTDGTSAMVSAEFPDVSLVRHDESRGYIARRNEGARVATGDIVFSIDDDAVFSTPRIVEQTLALFEGERIGAVAIPFIDVNRSTEIRQASPSQSLVYVTDSFIGTAHAVRRLLFLQLGGYREQLIHQGEEGDFCIRMLHAGCVVRLGVSDPIHHFESPKRDLSRMDYFGPRNSVLFAWQNVPSPFVCAHLPLTTLKCILLTFKLHRLRTRVSGILDGYRRFAEMRREPVSRAAYLLSRELRNGGPKLLSDLDLPSLNSEVPVQG